MSLAEVQVFEGASVKMQVHVCSQTLLLKTACKSLIILYYHQILESFFYCLVLFQLVQVLYFFLELIGHRPLELV